LSPARYGAVARQDGQDYREELQAKGWLAPLPRYLYGEMNDGELANEMKEQYEMRRAQMGPRIIMDMRDLRYFDPEQLQDQWIDYWTGTPKRKLSKSKGRSIEIFPWTGVTGEAVVGLLTGRKPFAYNIDVEPENPDSEADAIQADAIEGWLLRQRDRWPGQNYELTYMDLVAWQMLLGRSWRMVTTDPVTRKLRTERMWPGHVAAFWQGDQRTLEQVIVARDFTIGEAIAMYAPNWKTDDAQYELRDQMLSACGIVEPINGFAGGGGSRSLQRNAQVQMLSGFYRLGDGQMGDAVGMCTTLLGTTKDGINSVLVDKSEDAGFEDIPLYCTPRFKIPDKPPDEATGIIRRIAGAQTEFNEVFSATRDMLNRTIYPRLKARGFSYRNAPRFIRESAMYAMPREGQDIQRIEETLNTIPVEQVLTRLEEIIVVMGGLNRFFLQSAPTSETSGDAIDASMTATAARNETSRTETQAGEIWTHRQWLAQGEKWYTETYQGQTIELKRLIEGKRNVRLFWGDMVDIGKTRKQQMMLAFHNAALASDDMAMDSIGVQSKTDEKRKIRKAFQDPVLHPDRVSQTASAMAQLAAAKAAQGGGPKGPDKRINISLAGPLSAQAAAELAGVSSVAPPTQGGTRAIPGRQPTEVAPGAPGAGPAAAAQSLVESKARGAPPNLTSDNQPGGVNPPTQPGDVANPAGRTGPFGPPGG
jgi:hypothetical protein